MRIGIDCRLWNEGGVGRYIRNLVWNLAELDKENEYILFLNRNSKSEIRNPKQIVNQNSKFKTFQTSAKWHSLNEQITFWQELEKEKLDLMHFTYFSHPILYNHPFVITVHDLTILKYKTGRATTKSYPLYLLKRRGYTEVLKHGIYKATKIIVPTRFVKQDILENFNVPAEKIVVTYEGAGFEFKNSKQFRISNFEFRDYILYVGNFYPHKNFGFLLKALSQAKKDINLVAVGSNDFFRERAEKEVAALSLEKRVKFVSGVSNLELSELYKNAVALVLPSKFEGFGLPIVEATSIGCPTLLSSIAVFREVAPKTAVFFDLNNVMDLTEKINEMNSSKKKLLSSEEKKAYLAKFDFRRMAEETLETYGLSKS